jgi:hypothetical protein
MKKIYTIEEPPEYRITGSFKANPFSIEQVMRELSGGVKQIPLRTPSRPPAVTVGLNDEGKERLKKALRVISEKRQRGEIKGVVVQIDHLEDS